MSLENEIRDILFEIGKDVMVYRVTKDNYIIDIDYEKYVSKILQLISCQCDKCLSSNSLDQS